MLDEKKISTVPGTGQDADDSFADDSTVEMIDVIPELPEDKDISLEELTARISADFEAHHAMEEAEALQEEDFPEEIELAAPPRREISIADLADEISAKMERRELAEKTVAAMEANMNRQNSVKEASPSQQEAKSSMPAEKNSAATDKTENSPVSTEKPIFSAPPKVEKPSMKETTKPSGVKPEAVAEKSAVTPAKPQEDISEEENTEALAKEFSEYMAKDQADRAGEKYVDTETKQQWAEIDDAFEERRKRRAEQRQARQEALLKAKRRRNLTILAVILLVCAAAFAFAWSQGFLNRGSDAQPSAPAPVETPAETETATAEETVPPTEEASTEEITTEAEFFDQSTEAVGIEEADDHEPTTTATGLSPADPVSFFDGYELDLEDAPEITDEEVDSPYAILVDLDTGDVIAQRGADTIINPASMTKILTVLVAAEHLVQEDLDDTVTIDTEILDYVYLNGCSVVGFEEGEEVTVRDLFLGTILPSGADAALALAKYVAGSQEAFVRLMNEKLDRLGLSDTAHFTNCVGLYDENHYCTVADMAMIMKAAAKDNYARKVLAAHVYTTTETDAHPEGLVISNWFLRRIEDRDTHGTVMCAKTGFVNESGNCAASYMVGNNGKNYVCVTAGTYSSWRCIYDHVQLYTDYVPE